METIVEGTAGDEVTSTEYPWYNPGQYLVDMRRPDQLIEINAQADFAGNINDSERWGQLYKPFSLTDPESGQRFGAVELNPNGDETAVVVGEYSTDHQDWQGRSDSIGPYAFEVVELARRNPDYRLIAINNPSTPPAELTSRLSRAQRRDLRHGSFSSLGEPLARALAAAGVEVKHLFGNSQGGRDAIAVAYAHWFPELETVGFCEVPGVAAYNYFNFTLGRFMGIEAAHKAKYLERSQNQQHAEMISENDTMLAMAKGVGRWAVKGVALDWLVRYPNAMRQDALYSDIHIAMAQNPQARFIWYAATAGAVAPIAPTMETFEQLHKQWGERLQMYRLPGATHSFSNANAHYLAAGPYRITLEGLAA